MKHVAVDPRTQKLVAPNEANRSFAHKYVPRIRCHDCPAKTYMAGPGMTAENFESHVLTRQHKAQVEARVARAA